jgi:hypothetical protein
LKRRVLESIGRLKFPITFRYGPTLKIQNEPQKGSVLI